MNVYVGTNTLKNAYIGEYVPPLNFTANTAGSTVKLQVGGGSPSAISLERSTDGQTWSAYTLGTTITLSSVGSSVFFRSTSTTDTTFSTNTSDYYQFVMTGSIAASGNISYLLNKNGTNTLKKCCFANLFRQCTSLTSCPSFPSTTLANNCYYFMFYQCTALTTLPKLPATTISNYAYYWMFKGCTNIKLSATQTGIYQKAYRIPTTGTGSAGTNALYQMFKDTGGTYSGTPSINTTYYTSNTVV